MSPNLFDKIIKNVKINLHLNINRYQRWVRGKGGPITMLTYLTKLYQKKKKKTLYYFSK